MPIPIMGIPDKDREDKNEGVVDYSFLANHLVAKPTNKKIVTASNKDASILYEIWSKSEKTKDGKLQVKACGIDNKEILRLKTMGLISGGSESIEITSRGKRVITVMALGEVNHFEKSRQDKPYNEILASLSKKNKPGYRTPKFAASSFNNIRLAGLDVTQVRTLADIFNSISDKCYGAELSEKKSDDPTETTILIDFRGVEGEVKISVIYLDGMIMVQKEYTQGGERATDSVEFPVNYDYPQTTVDNVVEAVDRFRRGM